MKRHLTWSFLIFFICLKAYPTDVPASLSIKGSALNESASPMDMKKKGDTFELFTSLKSGEYAFDGDPSIPTAKITIAGEVVPYRIRVSYEAGTPEVSVAKVTKVVMYAPANDIIVAEMVYKGHSTFAAKNIFCDEKKWGDNRYRIKIYTDKDVESFGIVNPDDGMTAVDFRKPCDDFDIEEVTRYAKEKGVTVIGHHETGGNIRNYENQMEDAYDWFKDFGIVNIKTGYAGVFPEKQTHHSQYGVNHYQRVIELAARKHITINAHEPIKDTGIRRTWPNFMSREGARGMEWNGWSEGNPPSHTVILPYTRLLSGPMDYTPGTFDVTLEYSKNHPDHQKWHALDQGNSRVNTTLVKQMANWVIIYSPVQMASDLIEIYKGHPCFQFFRDFEADCDWSKAIAGEIGEFVVMVRRAKGKYFLGASTDETSRNVGVKFDFLEKGKTYRATIYADAANADWKTNPTAYTIEEKIVNSDTKWVVRMAPGGGQAISFIEVTE